MAWCFPCTITFLPFRSLRCTGSLEHLTHVALVNTPLKLSIDSHSSLGVNYRQWLYIDIYRASIARELHFRSYTHSGVDFDKISNCATKYVVHLLFGSLEAEALVPGQPARRVFARSNALCGHTPSSHAILLLMASFVGRRCETWSCISISLEEHKQIFGI